MRACVALSILLLVSTPAWASDDAPSDQATVDGTAARGAQGRIAVNQAAGTGNAQANLGAIASSDGGLGIVGVHAAQHPGATAPALRERDAAAHIQGGAFSGTQGVLSVNQIAGSGNAQANLFMVGQGPQGVVAAGVHGITGIDDAALADVAGDANTTEGAVAPSWRREAVIADDAFRGSQGVVQVNQTAGVGNSSTNAIVLQLPGGTP
ncbi:MAG: hypothetical protein A2579_08415 [Lysobacterales bacterium RIFOXYD1_FULL_69_11]|nr:MAG: hypothetical protein A2190_06910 [Xanthomonadales bacterium RIFOXYA1_FULL_69_10]OHE87891.1 MAG: hypothetical protein A2579_08415 [Xanthomonadales bacterium RIFOXYD1_FULL_69_11]